MRTPRPLPSSLCRHSRLAAAIACALAAQGAAAVTYTVLNAGASGAGSLADAVTQANNNCPADPNPVIDFNIPGPGPFVIQPSAAFIIRCNTTIDGYTQPGAVANTDPQAFNATLQIGIDATNVLDFSGTFYSQDFGYGASYTLKGVEVYNFTYGGFSGAIVGDVRLFGSVIRNNAYGVEPSGTQANPAAVGGAAPADRNVIRNNTNTGVLISYGGWVNVTNNLIGTNDTASGAASNNFGIELRAFDGVSVSNNVIAGNLSDGLHASDYPYLTTLQPLSVVSNHIGHNFSGSPIPNGGSGVFLSAISNASIVNNVIASNSVHGVGLVNGFGSTSGVIISQNSIHSNAVKNIDLDFYGGPLLNDLGDVDTVPPNLGQNHPVVNLVTQSGGNTSVSWSLNSEASSTYQVQLYANAFAGTPAGTTLIAIPPNQVTDPSGNVSGVEVISGLHNNISALAINQSFGDTSEFSAAVALTPTPEVTVSPNPATFPDTVVGASSSPIGVVVSSVGTAPYTINAFDTAPTCYGGPICSGGAFICSSGCSTATPYAPSASCTINITFSPSTLGPHSGSFYLCDNAAGSPRLVSFSGNAIAPPPPTITPPSFDFGSVAVGGFSTVQTFTVANPSPASTSLSSFTATGPFEITGTTCGATLAASPGPGDTCTVDARFAPTVSGPASGALSATAGSGPVSATLAGTATPPPPTTMAPISIDFGTVVVGQTSAIGTFTVTNPSLVPTTLGTFTVTPPFVLDSTTCTSSLPPSSSCAASVKFAPLATGPASGTISILANGSTLSSGLAGNGAPVPPPPMVTITPSSVDFGSVTVGTFSTPQTFSVFNPDTNPVSLGTISTTGFYAIQSTTCGASLPPSGTCSVDVKFGPTAVGPASGSLDVPASTGNVYALLSGTGTAAAALTVSPPGYDFGVVLVGTSSVPRTFTISNPGASTASLMPLTTTGPFALASTNCTSALPPSATCDANVRFAPTGSGNASGSLVVSSTAGTASATLVGTGLLQAVLDMPTTPIDLGTGTLGGAPLTHVLTLRNGGNSALTIDNIAVGAPFTLTNGCPVNLLPGDSCQVTIALSPTELGTFNGNLSVVTNAPGGSRSIAVRALVQARPEPVIRVSPSSIGFGDRMGNTVSPAQRVTVFNEGGADATGLAIGINQPHFLVQNTSCTAVLAPQSTCFADVVFQPIGFGPKRGTLSVSSNAPTAVVNLSGAGCRPPLPSAGRTPRLNCAP